MRNTKHVWAVAAALLFGGCVGQWGDSGESGETGSILNPLNPCLDTDDPLLCNYDEEEAPGGCFVTGIGHIGDIDDHPGAGRADQDSFGGNAMGMKDGSVRGQWQNTTHLGDVFHGSANWLRCWRDDGLGPEVPRAEPNNAEWGGIGKWNHEDGYAWKVHAADRAEGGSHYDEYEIWIWSASGELVYSQTGELIDGGNFQIHPPNNGHPYETEYSPAPGDMEYFSL